LILANPGFKPSWLAFVPAICRRFPHARASGRASFFSLPGMKPAMTAAEVDHEDSRCKIAHLTV
jgi:hypothetical protein